MYTLPYISIMQDIFARESTVYHRANKHVSGRNKLRRLKMFAITQSILIMLHCGIVWGAYKARVPQCMPYVRDVSTST